MNLYGMCFSFQVVVHKSKFISGSFKSPKINVLETGVLNIFIIWRRAWERNNAMQ